MNIIFNLNSTSTQHTLLKYINILQYNVKPEILNKSSFNINLNYKIFVLFMNYSNFGT